jgi:hypothetical protein
MSTTKKPVKTDRIACSTELFSIKGWTILLLPKEASAQLPSRGLNLIKASVNDYDFVTALEPDGNGSHWFTIDDALSKNINAKPGDTVTLSFEATKEWPEPEIPNDINSALQNNPAAHETWLKTTPLAHWEWIRWIRATNNTETRQRRIDVACSKLTSGMRRPCCFNSNMCTVPEVSKNGVLLETAQSTV